MTKHHSHYKNLKISRKLQFGMWLHPFIVGDWPAEVIERVASRSLAEGRSKSRLPQFTAEEIEYIKGTFDWIGIN